mmetsp:Transcript_23035/g.26310  ORF Transcript_23035/g.26310 Transcript_23035/m.26310 type:complete len:102 (-) Transcript_23035:359-664(-)
MFSLFSQVPHLRRQYVSLNSVCDVGGLLLPSILFTTRRDSLALPHASVISLCRHHLAFFWWGDSRPIFVVVPSEHIRVRYFSNQSESDLSVPTVVVLFIKD